MTERHYPRAAQAGASMRLLQQIDELSVAHTSARGIHHWTDDRIGENAWVASRLHHLCDVAAGQLDQRAGRK